MSVNMEVWSLTGILLVLYACRTSGVPITYDFTDPLNAIRAGNLSVDEFSTNIKSHFGNLTTPLKLSVAYSPVALKSLENQSTQAKLNIPEGKHDISLFLPDNTTCDDLQNITKEQWTILMNSSTWISPDALPNVRNVGFGYNEGLIGCGEMRPAYLLMTKYLLTTISLGKTSCVVESFGLFKKRIDDVHNRNIVFTEYGTQLPFIDYSSTSHCLGDEYYGHLRERYWKRYTNSTIGAAIPLPVGHFEIPSYSAKKIIPYIDTESCHGRESYPWYASSALRVLSRYFGTVVLTHVQWKELQSNATGSATNGNPDVQVDLFIDYSDWLQYNPENLNFSGRDYNWSVVERELNKLDDTILHPRRNTKVTTLIFSMQPSSPVENFTANVNSGFARKMSSRLQIGCAFGPNSFEAKLNSTSSAVVTACKKVNGSIYTLQNYFKLKSITEVNKENSQHFENIVRPKLEKMRKFKDEILVLHPQATVYFQLRIELQMDDNQTTVFCNSEALSLNEYVEATANWAALNGIPLIMGRAFDDICMSKYQTWFSNVKPEEEYYINPRFVLRNSPQIPSDAEVEPCLEWTAHRPTVNESYFFNNYLGSLLYTLEMRNDKPITREEYKTLLQFTFHRFDRVIIYVERDSYTDFLMAINTLASEELIGSTKKVFIFYRDLRDEVDVKAKLREFHGFLNFTKVTLGSNTQLLKAIFSNIAYFPVAGEQDLLFSHNSMVVEWGRNLRLDVGVALNTDDCGNIIVNATSRKHIPKKADNLLHTATYLLCWESVDLKKYGNPKSLGTLFDTHIYTKLVYQEFYPHLNVYFEIFLNVILTESTITDYLILLSHFQKIAIAYNLSYLIVNAFDDDFKTHNGWWKISNFSNLSLTSIYEERYSALTGFKTWRPSPQTNSANDNKLYIIFGGLTSGLLVLIAVLGSVLWYYKNKLSQYLSNEEVKEFYNGKKGTSDENTAGDSEYRKFDKKFELVLADVYIDPKDLLGRGNFGTVYKGLVKEEPVAIKQPNENCPATSFKSVLCEVKLLCYIGTHPNVIQFVGAYTKEIRKGILYIAMEFCSNGSLDGLLRKKKRVISNVGDADNETTGTEDDDAVYLHDLHRFAKEIASGMDYIAEKNVIHGDLSARNVLLDEHFTCKIGDFGLSRKLYQYVEYVKQSQEPLPWKWMAYESLENMHFTTKSDAWSYGVTIWEIYSLGKVPYGGLSWTAGFTDDVENGLRLQMPKYATEEIYKAMLSCWELEADKRPTFTDMVDFFKELSSSQYIVLEI